DDRLGFSDGLAGASRNGYARRGGRGLRRIDEVEAGDLVARLDEIGAHRRAHVAETDEGDACHELFRMPTGSAKPRLSASTDTEFALWILLALGRSGGCHFRVRFLRFQGLAAPFWIVPRR